MYRKSFLRYIFLHKSGKHKLKSALRFFRLIFKIVMFEPFLAQIFNLTHFSLGFDYFWSVISLYKNKRKVACHPKQRYDNTARSLPDGGTIKAYDNQ